MTDENKKLNAILKNMGKTEKQRLTKILEILNEKMRKELQKKK